MSERKEKNLKEIFKEIEQEECTVQKAIRLLNEFIDGPMCGRCLPCPMGSYEMRVRFQRLASGEGTMQDIEAIQRIAPKMYITSMCKRGKDVAEFIDTALKERKEYFEDHVKGRCPVRLCKALFVYRIIPEKCTMCGDCLEVCKDLAIVGEKKSPFRAGYLPFEIIEKKCTRCGECIKVCKYDAIEIVDIGETQPQELTVEG